MFEYDQNVVKILLEENREFSAIYEKHRELDDKVHEAVIGTLPLDDWTLHTLKKEKLHLRDKMASKIEGYKRKHTA